MQDDRVDLRGVKVHPFSSFGQLLDYVTGRKGILVAINAEKILHATPQTRDIINRNIGYCDGIGAVMALRKHGYKDVVKLPGCELWLKIINSLYRDGKRFYLVGSKQEVIEATVEKLKREYPGINIAGYRNGYIKTDNEYPYTIETRVNNDFNFVQRLLSYGSDCVLLEPEELKVQLLESIKKIKEQYKND